MSYSKKIFLLYRSYEFRIKEIDEDIRRICVRSFGVNNSVERIFDRVCVKAKEKDDLFLIAEKVETVLNRLRKKDREILLYRYMNVFPEDSDKKIFSRSGFYRRLSIAEAIFEEYLSYIGLGEGTFEKKVRGLSLGEEESKARNEGKRIYQNDGERGRNHAQSVFCSKTRETQACKHAKAFRHEKGRGEDKRKRGESRADRRSISTERRLFVGGKSKTVYR